MKFLSLVRDPNLSSLRATSVRETARKAEIQIPRGFIRHTHRRRLTIPDRRRNRRTTFPLSWTRIYRADAEKSGPRCMSRRKRGEGEGVLRFSQGPAPKNNPDREFTGTFRLSSTPRERQTSLRWYLYIYIYIMKEHRRRTFYFILPSFLPLKPIRPRIGDGLGPETRYPRAH